MGYQMTEQNFVLMHKEVAYQIISKPTIHTTINMLKLNRVVKVHRQQMEQHNDEPAAQPQLQPTSSDQQVVKAKKSRN